MIKIQAGTHRITFDTSDDAKEFCAIANDKLITPCLTQEQDEKIVYLPYFMRHWKDETMGAPWKHLRDFLNTKGYQSEY